MDSEDEDQKEETKGVKFPASMYISEGNKYLRLFKYNKAIEFFNNVLEAEPNNDKCLIGRSTCNLRLANYAEAKQDAEAALKANPKSCEAKMLIGEAEYFLGDFEKAFLIFHRGHTARPNYDRLRLGHQMCRRAIENALNPDKPMIINEQDISSLCSVSSEQESIPKGIKDSLSPDLKFIDTILNDSYLESVHPDCKYLIKYMKDRQLFWRTQKPDASKRKPDTSEPEDREKKSGDKLKENIESKSLKKQKSDTSKENSYTSELEDREKKSGDKLKEDIEPKHLRIQKLDASKEIPDTSESEENEKKSDDKLKENIESKSLRIQKPGVSKEILDTSESEDIEKKADDKLKEDIEAKSLRTQEPDASKEILDTSESEDNEKKADDKLNENSEPKSFGIQKPDTSREIPDTSESEDKEKKSDDKLEENTESNNLRLQKPDTSKENSNTSESEDSKNKLDNELEESLCAESNITDNDDDEAIAPDS